MNITKTVLIGLSATSLICNPPSCAPNDSFTEEPVPENTESTYLFDHMLELLKQDPASAVKALEEASFQRQQKSLAWDETDFVITFCKAIAYDKLGMDTFAKDSLDLLCVSLTDAEANEPLQEDPLTIGESWEALGFMSALTTLAFSQDTQTSLQSIVMLLAKEMLPLFQIAPPLSFDRYDWRFAQSSDIFSIEPCSNFWKRWKHILKKFDEWLQRIERIIGILKDTKILEDGSKIKDENTNS